MFDQFFMGLAAAIGGFSLQSSVHSLSPDSNWRLVIPMAIGAVSSYERRTALAPFARRSLHVSSSVAWTAVGWEAARRFL